jgi:ribosomal protein S27AE
MRILMLDTETAPNTAHVWGLFKQNIGLNQIVHTGRVMCFAWKWYGEKGKVEFASEVDGHPEMIRKAYELLTDADAVVHYNGARFDVPVLNREFLKLPEKLPPPAPYAQIDLLKTARKRFRFASNKLDHLLKELNIGGKVRHIGHELWVRCMNGDEAAWKMMERYNKRDVTMLEKLYRRMLPWIENHPNHGLYVDADEPRCPSCGSKALQKRGHQKTLTQIYQRFQCGSCGSWSRARTTSVPVDKRSNVLRSTS